MSTKVVFSRLAAAASFAFTLGACVEIESGIVSTGDRPSFEEFAAGLPREPGGRYVVDGDVPMNEKQLVEFYREVYDTGALVVGSSGSSDVKWSATRKRNLTYCISDAFGDDKALMVEAMEAATVGGWEAAADVDFVYLSQHDGNCTASNTQVLFDIRPERGQSYLARAFFPDESRRDRNILVDDSSFTSGWPIDAILAHELGHVLGFRHEHTRPEAGTCYEDNRWRPLTPYDGASIMHYPQCNGTSGGELSFTASDFEGAEALYGAPGGEPGQPPPPSPSPSGEPRSGSASGSVGEGESIDYGALAVVPGTVIRVAMTGSGDADLYLRFDAAPTRSLFDCRPYLNGSNETCELDVPAGASEAHIKVTGYAAASYTLEASWVEPR